MSMNKKIVKKNPAGVIPLSPTGKDALNEKDNLTAIGIHAASQFFGDNKSLTLFSGDKIDGFINDTGIEIINRPQSYGVLLNQSQHRVFEGILKAFSNTKYLGHTQIESRDSLSYRSSSKAAGRINNAYKNTPILPVVRLTQSEIIRLSGYEKKRGDKTDVIEAIAFLATKQFCFYWIRLVRDDKGVPVIDKNGEYLKEEVMEVGTIFRIKTVREDGKLKYYEIHPSSVIIDQANSKYGGNYFLLIPTNWREEVQQLTGKKASSYTYLLLLWLRLQYEQIRRYNANSRHKTKKPFILYRSWEDIAIALKMPESMYKANRPRAVKIIQEAYIIAIKLGYLLNVDNTGATDILYLNEDYYPKPGELT